MIIIIPSFSAHTVIPTTDGGRMDGEIVGVGVVIGVVIGVGTVVTDGAVGVSEIAEDGGVGNGPGGVVG
jgi:hypothetical protein